jgi:hypothetical protein
LQSNALRAVGVGEGEEAVTVGVSDSIGSGVADMDAVGVSVGSGVMDGLRVREGPGDRVGLWVVEGEGIGIGVEAALGTDSTVQAARESTRPMRRKAFFIVAFAVHRLRTDFSR